MLKKPALMLPEGAVSSTEAQTFGDIPGVYSPGEPVALDATGIDEDRAKEIDADPGNPLELTEASVARGKPLGDLDRGDLADIAAEHNLTVERADGEGEPVKSDYLRVLGEAGIETDSPDELPIAGRHYDASALEPGEPVPPLPPAGKIASAPEGSNPDGSPLLPEGTEG